MKSVSWRTAALVACCATTAFAARQEMNEYEWKSRFLYNVCVYAEWPAAAFAANDSPIVIGIVGKDPFGESMTKIFGENTAQKRKIEIKKFDAVKNIKDCHILFLPATEKENLAAALAKLKGTNTLLIGESEGLGAKGAVLNLLIEDKQKVKVEFNADAAERAGIKLSSKLVKLTKPVQDEK